MPIMQVYTDGELRYMLGSYLEVSYPYSVGPYAKKKKRNF